MYYSYLLFSKKDGKFYSGYTRDLKNRLKEHQTGKVFSTKHRLPVELIYFEGCIDQDDALQIDEAVLEITAVAQTLIELYKEEDLDIPYFIIN